MIIFIQSSKIRNTSGTASCLFYKMIKLLNENVIFIEYLPAISEIKKIRDLLPGYNIICADKNKNNKGLIISTFPQLPKYGIDVSLGSLYSRFFGRLFMKAIFTIIKESLDKEQKENLVFIFHPLIYRDCRELLNKNGKIIYYILDDWADITENKKLKKIISYYETELIKKSFCVFAVSDLLKEKYAYLNKEIVVIPNGVDANKFIKKKYSKYLKYKDKKPIIGFVGTLGTWVDTELIIKISKNFKNAKIVLVGRDLIGLKNLIEKEKLTNINYLGPIDHEQVPDIISIMDVCINPFNNSITARYSSPIKVYEYLAMGKQVVTSYIDVLKRELYNHIFIAQSHGEFINYISDILYKNVRKSPPDINLFSWESRLKDIINYMKLKGILI